MRTRLSQLLFLPAHAPLERQCRQHHHSSMPTITTTTIVRIDRQPLSPHTDRHDALHACAANDPRDEAAELVLAPGRHLKQHVRESRLDMPPCSPQSRRGGIGVVTASEPLGRTRAKAGGRSEMGAKGCVVLVVPIEIVSVGAGK